MGKCPIAEIKPMGSLETLRIDQLNSQQEVSLIQIAHLLIKPKDLDFQNPFRD
jgi:hypothetical protein